MKRPEIWRRVGAQIVLEQERMALGGRPVELLGRRRRLSGRVFIARAVVLSARQTFRVHLQSLELQPPNIISTSKIKRITSNRQRDYLTSSLTRDQKPLLT